MVLEKSIQHNLDNLADKSYGLYVAGNKEGSYMVIEEAWGLCPNPPEDWNESHNTASYAFYDLIRDGELEKATIWYERMTKGQQNLGL